MIQKTHRRAAPQTPRLTERKRTFILTRCWVPSIPALRVVVACVRRGVGREEIE